MSASKSKNKPLRVVFCTSPSIYSTIVMQELIRSPHLKLVGVVASTRILRKKGWSWWDVVLLVRRTGIHYAVYLWIITSLHTLSRRLWRHDPLREYLAKNSVPILQSRDINGADGSAFVQACTPDVMLSAHFNQLIGPALLTLPPKGCLNIHPGLLPAYKGVDPVAHALARKEKQVGVTVHFQDHEFDTGPVVATKAIPVEADDSLFSLNCKLFRFGIRMLLDTIEATGGISGGIPQDRTDSHDSWPDAVVLGKLRNTGRCLFKTKELHTIVILC
jgi:methionyl-tRNA formyltransferase